MRALTSAAVRTVPQQFTGPQPAKVLRVTGGKLYVELDAEKGLEIGPCQWHRPLAAHFHSDPDGNTGTYTPADPPTGTRCLLLFAGDGVTDPWVVGWSGWPA